MENSWIIWFSLIVLYFVCSYMVRKQRERIDNLKNQIKENTVNELMSKGMLLRQGNIGLVVHHVYNQEIAEIFIKKFDEACKCTAGSQEILNGDLKIWFKVQDTSLGDDIKRELEKAGYYIGNI